MPDSNKLCTKWWARIKYIEDFLDYIPVSQISECDDNLIRSQPFQPQNFTDFVSDKYYIVQTDKFNRDEDGDQKIYYALIGSLAESEESLKKSSKKIKWPDMHEDSLKSETYCNKCKEINVAGTKNIKKRRKTTKPCCSSKLDKPHRLLSLLLELKSDTEALIKSIEEQLILVMDKVKKLKKRLYTDICVYNPMFDDPYLPVLRTLVMSCFTPIEKFIGTLEKKPTTVFEFLREMYDEIEDHQIQKIPLPSWVIISIDIHVSVLKSMEQSVSKLDASFASLMEQVAEMEERLID